MKKNLDYNALKLDFFLSEDDLKTIHAGLLKFTWKSDVKINLFKNADPDKDVLGL